MACWANVSNLRIADWAHDKIAVNWSGALRADAVVRQLVLTKGNIKVLLLAVNEVAAWTQNNVCKQTNNRNNRNDCPHPPRLCAATLSVTNNVDDGKDIASSIDVVFDEDEKGCYPLADIKTTSKIHKNNVSLQLSIYAYLFEKCNKGKKAGRLFVVWLPKEQYGKAELMELNRISATDCKKIVKAYLAKEDSTPYREKYFGAVETSTELEPIEEALPATLKDAEDEIIKIETQLKQMEERKKELKEGLYNLMEEHNVKKWQSERIQIVRKLDSTRESIDTAKVKKMYPDVYKECLKVSKVKGSITINIL